MSVCGLKEIKWHFNSFTEVFYHDWRHYDDYWDDDYWHWDPPFEGRYKIFQEFSPEIQPGYTIGPVMVDVMFEILSINEREIRDSLNINDSRIAKRNFYNSLLSFKWNLIE